MSRTLMIAAGMLLVAPQLAFPSSAHAQASAAVVRVDAGADASAQTLDLPQGRSAVVDLPRDARDVLVSNPTVASAVLRTPRRIFVLGVKSGVTDAVFFDAAGRRILTLSVRVDANTSSISDTINRLIPGSHVHVDAMNDAVILSGVVPSTADADKAQQIALAAVGKDGKVLNMVTIADKDQVMLKVRIVEMQRSVIKQLGFNWQAVIGKVGDPQFVLGTAATWGVNGSLLGGILAGAQQSNASRTVQGNIQAFERVGLVRTLAEPNLTTTTGEAAKFLVGGSFPVPSSVADNGQVSVSFKDYGVGLGFTPVVLSGGRISLKLSTEVSELSNQGAYSISTGTGGASLVVPALVVRRAETVVELPSGGAMMIAGLLQDNSSQDLDAVPGIKDLPILGALFRSRDYQAGQTELVVIVTPYLVSPTSPADFDTPADGLQTADEASTILLGKLNKAYKRPPDAAAGRTYQGPYGYVVE